jgi:hypothetical protein
LPSRMFCRTCFMGFPSIGYVIAMYQGGVSDPSF